MKAPDFRGLNRLRRVVGSRNLMRRAATSKRDQGRPSMAGQAEDPEVDRHSDQTRLQFNLPLLDHPEYLERWKIRTRLGTVSLLILSLSTPGTSTQCLLDLGGIVLLLFLELQARRAQAGREQSRWGVAGWYTRTRFVHGSPRRTGRVNWSGRSDWPLRA